MRSRSPMEERVADFQWKRTVKILTVARLFVGGEKRRKSVGLDSPSRSDGC